jgi:hypothetical protein
LPDKVPSIVYRRARFGRDFDEPIALPNGRGPHD